MAKTNISLDEYNEWRSSAVTQAMFDFFKREEDTYRAILASATLEGTDSEVGEKYKYIRTAINCYGALANLSYEDIEDTYETD